MTGVFGRRLFAFSWAVILCAAARVQLPGTWAGDSVLLAVIWTAGYPIVATTSFAQGQNWDVRYWAMLGIMLLVTSVLRAVHPPFAIQVLTVGGVMGIAIVLLGLARSRGRTSRRVS